CSSSNTTMLPLTEMLGPSGPLVATRQGAPSSQADRIKSRIFWLIGIVSGPCCVSMGPDNTGGGVSISSRSRVPANRKRPAAPAASPAIARETPCGAQRPCSWKSVFELSPVYEVGADGAYGPASTGVATIDRAATAARISLVMAVTP